MPTISCYAGKREFYRFLEINNHITIEEAEKHLTEIGNESIRKELSKKLPEVSK